MVSLSQESIDEFRARTSLEAALSQLDPSWLILVDLRINGPTDPTAADYVALHPRRGIALIDVILARTGDPAQRLRKFLNDEGFSAHFTGNLPIVRLVLRPTDAATFGRRVHAAFGEVPPITIGDPNWVAAINSLLVPTAPAAARPIFPQTKRPKSRPQMAPPNVAPQPPRRRGDDRAVPPRQDEAWSVIPERWPDKVAGAAPLTRKTAPAQPAHTADLAQSSRFDEVFHKTPTETPAPPPRQKDPAAQESASPAPNVENYAEPVEQRVSERPEDSVPAAAATAYEESVAALEDTAADALTPATALSPQVETSTPAEAASTRQETSELSEETPAASLEEPVVPATNVAFDEPTEPPTIAEPSRDRVGDVGDTDPANPADQPETPPVSSLASLTKTGQHFLSLIQFASLHKHVLDNGETATPSDRQEHASDSPVVAPAMPAIQAEPAATETAQAKDQPTTATPPDLFADHQHVSVVEPAAEAEEPPTQVAQPAVLDDSAVPPQSEPVVEPEQKPTPLAAEPTSEAAIGPQPQEETRAGATPSPTPPAAAAPMIQLMVRRRNRIPNEPKAPRLPNESAPASGAVPVEPTPHVSFEPVTTPSAETEILPFSSGLTARRDDAVAAPPPVRSETSPWAMRAAATVLLVGIAGGAATWLTFSDVANQPASSTRSAATALPAPSVSTEPTVGRASPQPTGSETPSSGNSSVAALSGPMPPRPSAKPAPPEAEPSPAPAPSETAATGFVPPAPAEVAATPEPAPAPEPTVPAIAKAMPEPQAKPAPETTATPVEKPAPASRRPQLARNVPPPKSMTRVGPPASRPLPAPAPTELGRKLSDARDLSALGPPIDAADLPPSEAPAAQDSAQSGPAPVTTASLAGAGASRVHGPTSLLPPSARNTASASAQPAPSNEVCRSYTSTKTLLGQARQVNGLACRDSTGQWQIITELTD